MGKVHPRSGRKLGDLAYSEILREIEWQQNQISELKTRAQSSLAFVVSALALGAVTLFTFADVHLGDRCATAASLLALICAVASAFYDLKVLTASDYKCLDVNNLGQALKKEQRDLKSRKAEAQIWKSRHAQLKSLLVIGDQKQHEIRMAQALLLAFVLLMVGAGILKALAL